MRLATIGLGERNYAYEAMAAPALVDPRDIHRREETEAPGFG